APNEGVELANQGLLWERPALEDPLSYRRVVSSDRLFTGPNQRLEPEAVPVVPSCMRATHWVLPDVEAEEVQGWGFSINRLPRMHDPGFARFQGESSCRQPWGEEGLCLLDTCPGRAEDD